MSRSFFDTPEAVATARSPILEENDRLHRRNRILFGIVVYTYFMIVASGIGYGVYCAFK